MIARLFYLSVTLGEMGKRVPFSLLFTHTVEIQIESAVIIIMPACVPKCRFFYITNVFALFIVLFFCIPSLWNEKNEKKSI